MFIDKSLRISQFFDKKKNRDINYIIFHHTKAANILLAIDLYKKFGVSAHYAINEEGAVYSLVEDNNIAYHCGYSYWDGCDFLNKYSIGIELICQDPEKVGYSDKQMASLIKLCSLLKIKYHIFRKNIVSHSDIAYFSENQLLNRKFDVSAKFNWHLMFDNKLCVNPDIFRHLIGDLEEINKMKIGDKSVNIYNFKKELSDFGYKVKIINNIFDEEAKNLLEVFKRRFVR